MSNVTGIIKNMNGWFLNMDKGLFAGVVLFNLTDVSNTVNHDILLEKCHRTTLKSLELGWFHS